MTDDRLIVKGGEAHREEKGFQKTEYDRYVGSHAG